MGVAKVKRIGKYEVLDVLGKGGMGVVYKATDPAIGRLVAIKMITSGFAEDPDFLRRFYREAQSTGKLQHQNVVIVHDLGDQDGTPFLVMEFLEGESLQSIINTRRPMPLLEKLGLIIQTCNGLHYAHQRNIVHRDIKPGNLMVLKDGLVKIVDFGIARVGNENVTMPGQVIGSIQYMSPEQINGVSVDCRTDIFSTGVVLYQLLTYSLPFEGKDTGSTLLKIINEPPPPLQNYLQVYPPDLDYIVHRALAKSRDDRYPSAEDFAFDLSQVQDQLKRELVTEYLKVAEDLIARSELGKAKEQVFQILRIDRQNPRANELLKDVQRLIQYQQRSEQARQLRSQAEEAIAGQQLERALKYLDQAITLDPGSTELQQLRDHAVSAKTKQEKIQDAIRRAESAQWAGELDEALAAVNEALSVDPDEIEARALHVAITREISERQRQSQVQELLDQAQKQISSRRFTAAIEALQKAEALDPVAPAIKDLLSLATTGREQERRRKEIEELTAEIQEALNRDDYRVACERADAAVQRFPNERGLLKLQALAERQRLAGEKRQFIDEQISRARKLLEDRQTQKALETLEAACNRYPAEPALLSMLTAVRENLQQERTEARKNEYIQRAKEFLRRKDYGEAISVLETARAELDAPEIEDLLQFVKDEAATHRKRQVVDAAAQEAHRLMTAEEYEDAIAFLKATMQELHDEELEIILADAQRQLDDFNRRVNDAVDTAERLLGAERVTEAVRYLESQTESCGRSGHFCSMLERARREQERMRVIATAVQGARSALAAQDFTAATEAIEQCRASVGAHPELLRMIGEIDSRRREVATKAVSKAVGDSRMLLLGRSYESAVELLDSVAGLVELAPGDVRVRYNVAREEAARGLERARREAESQALAPPPSRDEDTEKQLEWGAASNTVAASRQNRDRDLQELTELNLESNTVTNFGALDAVSQRARLIAKRYPEDTEVQHIAGQVANVAEIRAQQLAPVAKTIETSFESPPLSVGEQAANAPAELTSPVAVPEPPGPETAAQAELAAPITVVPESEKPRAPAKKEPEAAKPSTPQTLPERIAEAPTVYEPPSTAQEPTLMPVRPVPAAPPQPPVGGQRSAVLRVPEPETTFYPPSPSRSGPTLVPPPRTSQRSFPRSLVVGGLAILVLFGLIVWRRQSKPGAGGGTYAAVIRTTPEGATVRIKDSTCVTPKCKLELAPGTYDVSASLRGYAPQTAKLQVESGKSPPVVNLVLTPLTPVLRINGNFSKAKVQLDGRAVGSLVNGQLTTNAITAGQHTIKVTGPDGDAEFAFAATPAQAPVLSSPVRARNISVLVVSTMGGATHLGCNCAGTLKLAVDGRSFGELSDAGRDLGSLGEGVHEVAVGSGDDMRTASVEFGPAPAVEVFLNAERNAGTLVVETDVDGSEVFVNDKRYQQTAGGTLRIPLDVSDYTVRVQKAGYNAAGPQHVQIQKNHETRVTFKLTPREEKAFVAIRGGVAGTRINIDGNAVGAIDKAGQFYSPGLNPGEHEIRLDKDGFQSRTLRKAFRSGEILNLTPDEVQMAKTEPPPPPPATTVPPKTATRVQPIAPPVDPAQHEWEQLRNGADVHALQSYLSKFPASPFAAEANRKLEQLDWEAIKDSSDANAIQGFLDKHPNSAFADRARTRLQQTKAVASVESDRKNIMAVLDRYKTAYERADIGMLTQVWPTMDKQQIKNLRVFFNSAREVRVQLASMNGPDIRGDKATVASTQVVNYKLNDKAAKPIEAKISFELRKKDGTWVLDSIR